MKQAFLTLSLMAAFIAIIVAPAKAQTISGTTPEALAVQKFFAKSLPDWTSDPSARASFAKALHQYCESVLAQVPRNTPKEDQWVENEERDTSLSQQERLNRLYNSVEYIRKDFTHIVTECTVLTTKLMELKKASPAAEALLWVRLSIYFGSVAEDTVVDYAEALGMTSPKYCELNHMPIRKLFAPLSLPPPVTGGHDTNNFCSWGTVHNLIIIRAVIPLLEASSGQ
jgi:hypothetical protein